MKKTLFKFLILVFLPIAVASICAFGGHSRKHLKRVDSWAPPKPTNYYNIDKTYYVRVIPIFRSEKYRKWKNAKPKQKVKFSPADTTVTPCHAILYKVTQAGDSLIWKKDLINKVCPVNAYLSNDAQYMVTFDNWHSMGFGADVMVYYDNQGNLLKRHSLQDISPFPIDAYPRSVSSIWWRCDVQFADDKRIQICFQNEKGPLVSKVYNLEEGRIE